MKHQRKRSGIPCPGSRFSFCKRPPGTSWICKWAAGWFALVIFGSILGAGQEAEPFRVAVLKDGPVSREGPLLKLLRDEVSYAPMPIKILDGGHGDWDFSKVEEGFKTLLEREDVDLILADGVMATAVAAQEDLSLSKPVLSAFIHRAEVFDFPYGEEGEVTKDNFNMVAMPGGLRRDLEVFRKMEPFEELYAVVDGVYRDVFPEAEDRAKALAEREGISLKLRSGGTRAEPLLEKIPSGAAVYLTPLPRFSEEEWLSLIEGFQKKQIRSFSASGHGDVEAGILASLIPDPHERVARRLALHLEAAARTESVDDFSAYLEMAERLLINSRTAQRIDYAPPIDILLRAHFTEDRVEVGERVLTLEQAMERAAETPPEARRDHARTESARQRIGEARSGYFPRIALTGEFEQIDRERVRAARGLLPRRRTTAGAELRQILFSDEVRAEFEVAGEGLRIAEAEARARTLDRVERAGQAYLEVLSAKALWRLSLEDLALTRHHLDLAKVRRRVGASGPEEILRWEGEEVRQRAELFGNEAAFHRAQALLNRNLGMPMTERWDLVEIPVDEEEPFYFFGRKLEDLLQTTRNLARFREYARNTTLAESPLLGVIEGEQRVAERNLQSTRRERFLPVISAGAQWGRQLQDERPLTPGGSPQEEWAIGINASIPVFEGGRLRSERLRRSAEKRALSHEEAKLRQALALRTEDAVRALEGSYPSVRLSREAADKARETLELVQERYARGVLPLIDLLDAQNRLLSAEQEAILAWHRFLGDGLALQRSLGWFVFQDPERTEKWLEELQIYVNGNHHEEHE